MNAININLVIFYGICLNQPFSRFGTNNTGEASSKKNSPFTTRGKVERAIHRPERYDCGDGKAERILIQSDTHIINGDCGVGADVHHGNSRRSSRVS